MEHDKKYEDDLINKSIAKLKNRKYGGRSPPKEINLHFRK